MAWVRIDRDQVRPRTRRYHRVSWCPAIQGKPRREASHRDCDRWGLEPCQRPECYGERRGRRCRRS